MTEQTTIAVNGPDEGLLAAAVWHLDPWHTGVHFRALNRGAGWVRGQFTRVSGTVAVPDGPDRPTVEVAVDTASVSTAVPARNAHLRSADFLDTDNHPHMTFRARRLIRTGPDTARLPGELTLRGHTRAVTLDVQWRGTAPDAMSEREHLAFSATAEISLADFGIRAPILPGLGIPSVGDRIGIDLDVVLLPYDPAPVLANLPVD